MNFKLIRLSAIGIIFLLSGQLKSQESYNAEIGVNGGYSYYLGDANNSLFNNSQLTYGVIYRQKINPRIAAHINWNKTNVIGSGTFLDENIVNTVNFDNSVNVIDLCGEFNFLSLENKSYMPFSKTFSPFIFAGIGTMLYDYDNGSDVGVSLPFGVGFKLMLSETLNLNLQWSNRLLFNDKLEGRVELDNPYDLNGSNILNNDLLSTLSLGVTINIWKTKCDCQNSN